MPGTLSKYKVSRYLMNVNNTPGNLRVKSTLGSLRKTKIPRNPTQVKNIRNPH